MIDWAKVKIPLKHAHLLPTDMIMRISPDGVSKWYTPAQVEVKGSYDNNVYVKPDGLDSLIIDGNPAKFFQGHNIFGTDNIIPLIRDFITEICKLINFSPTAENQHDWSVGNYEALRIDCTHSFKIGTNNNHVQEWLRSAGQSASHKYQDKRSFGGESLLFGPRSRRYNTTLYNKLLEIKKHPISNKLSQQHKIQLEDFVQNILRFEVKLRSLQLKTKNLRKISNWDETTSMKIVQEQIMNIRMNQKIRLTTEDKKDLPPRLLAVYKLWKNGEDLRSIYTADSTYYRYRKELLNYGIDIRAPRPQPGQVIPIMRYLTAEHTVEAPQHLVDSDLYYKPKVAA